MRQLALESKLGAYLRRVGTHGGTNAGHGLGYAQPQICGALWPKCHDVRLQRERCDAVK